MRTLGIIALGLVLLIGGSVVWLQLIYPTYTYRYRITLEVEVDGVVKHGSTVIQVTRRWDPVPGRPINHYSTAAKGEALFVDLGTARNLFLLLTDEHRKNPEQLAAQAFHFGPTDIHDVLEQRRRVETLTAQRATTQLRPDQLPMLVSFTNPNDLDTAQPLRPSDFEQALGRNTHFRGAWLEMTNDPVTQGIKNKLPWWDKPQPGLTPLGGGVYTYTRTDSFKVHKENFRKGL